MLTPTMGATHSASGPGSPSTPAQAPAGTGDAAFMASLQAIPKMLEARRQQDNAPIVPVVDNTAQRAKLLAAAIAAAAKQQEGQIL